MSYILDALKKSDQERQRGTVPGMHSLQTTISPGRKLFSNWPILLAMMLLIGAGYLAWWWISPMSDGQKEDPITQLPARPSDESSASAGTMQADIPVAQPPKPSISARVQPSSNAEDQKTKGNSPKHSSGAVQVPTAETVPGSSIAKARGETARKPAVKLPSPTGNVDPGARIQRPPGQGVALKKPPEDSSTRILTEMERAATGALGKPVDMSTAGETGSGRLSGPNTAATTVTEALVPTPRTPARTQDAKVPSTNVTQAPAKPSKRTALPRDAQESQSATVQSATAGKSEDRIPELRELSPTVQRDVPFMSFSMLVYSEVPGDRMIRINGKLMHEGDEVASGLKLEEIVPGGAVFSFKGQRFRKGVF